MTFRARPVTKRARPSSGSGRRTLLLNLGFGLIVVAAVLILVGYAGASWYGDHFGAVAIVNGHTITRDEFRDQFTFEAFRLDQAKSRLQDEFQAGHLTQDERDRTTSAIEQQRQTSTLTALMVIEDGSSFRVGSDQGVATVPERVRGAQKP